MNDYASNILATVVFIPIMSGALFLTFLFALWTGTWGDKTEQI